MLIVYFEWAGMIYFFYDKLFIEKFQNGVVVVYILFVLVIGVLIIGDNKFRLFSLESYWLFMDFLELDGMKVR